MNRHDYFHPRTQDPSIRYQTHGPIEPMEGARKPAGFGFIVALPLAVAMWACIFWVIS